MQPIYKHKTFALLLLFLLQAQAQESCNHGNQVEEVCEDICSPVGIDACDICSITTITCGRYCPAGQFANGTICSDTCPENHYMSAYKQCMPCPEGTSRLAGDNQTSECCPEGYQQTEPRGDCKIIFHSDSASLECAYGQFRSDNSSLCETWSVNEQECNLQNRVFLHGSSSKDASCGRNCTEEGLEAKGTRCHDPNSSVKCNTLALLYAEGECCDIQKKPKCLQILHQNTQDRIYSLKFLQRQDNQACQEKDKVVFQQGMFLCQPPAEN